MSEDILEALSERHPEWTRWHSRWADYRLLYKAGDEFLAAAGQETAGRRDSGMVSLFAGAKKPKRFLWQLDGEPDDKYLSRWNRAKYTGYLGAIVDYFRHWLFSVKPVMRPTVEDAKEAPEAPAWFDDFSADCDGAGTDLLDFVRDVFLDVLLCRRAGWLVMKQEGEDGEPFPCLTRFPAEDILDWQHDEHGCLEWVLLRKERDVRAFPEPRKRLSVLTYVDRESWVSWEIDGEAATELGGAQHGLGSVPFVWFEIPEGLWVANKLASWQVDLFNQENMLSYGQLVGCFLQPFLRTHEGSQSAQGRIFGESIMLSLRCGMEGQSDEEFGWATPSVEPLKFSAELMRDKRDEGYRIVHQMSLAVDSQAVGAIARSGASKVEDRRATEVILCAFGGYVRESLKRTLELIGAILGDNAEWTVDGFDNFQVSGLDEELATAGLVGALDIPSPTFEKELKSQIATGRVLGHIDEATKQKIRDEIAEAVDAKAKAKEEAEAMAGVMAVAPGPEGEDTEDTEDTEPGEAPPVDADAA